MNRVQKSILFLMVALLIAIVLYPPCGHFNTLSESYVSYGHKASWELGSYYTRDYSILITEAIAILVAGSILCIATKTKNG
jgi:hypothetical protein